MTVSTGFHEGERAVQRRAGVTQAAERLSDMLARPRLGGGTRLALAERDLAVLSAHDRTGRLWVSTLVARPGDGTPQQASLRVDALPAAGDPLTVLAAGDAVGMIVINFAKRRRMRINGTVAEADPTGFELNVEQAYGNCPRYIQTRELDRGGAPHPAATADEAGGQPKPGERLTSEQIRMIERSDTFFLGTAHPSRGADASHRGGPPGFVRVTGEGLWWPDYPGNNVFNSLGNLAVDDSAALLFVDFATGETLQLSGTATVDWGAPGAPGDDGGTGRRVSFTPRRILAGRAALNAESTIPYQGNPPADRLSGAARPGGGRAAGRGRESHGAPPASGPPVTTPPGVPSSISARSACTVSGRTRAPSPGRVRGGTAATTGAGHAGSGAGDTQSRRAE